MHRKSSRYVISEFVKTMWWARYLQMAGNRSEFRKYPIYSTSYCQISWNYDNSFVPTSNLSLWLQLFCSSCWCKFLYYWRPHWHLPTFLLLCGFSNSSGDISIYLSLLLVFRILEISPFCQKGMYYFLSLRFLISLFKDLRLQMNGIEGL